ncbi:MAG TPA: hypothetical protein VHF89_17230 [Solirubrobacteraceae bacterium]|nr:hypothetical protein [Solirubrobacteraceae bacterium]
MTWRVSEPSLVALLDERFRQAARWWPSLMTVVEERALEQADRIAVHVLDPRPRAAVLAG